MFICEKTSPNLASEECTWVIDSGASFHITPSREYFSTYIVGGHGYVKMGDIGECKVAGVGSVYLTILIGCRLTLKDVQHVPDIRLNLISTKSGMTKVVVVDSRSFRNGKRKFC